MKKIGICAHSYEGGALCFTEVCREGGRLLGPHLHPSIVMSAIPMGWSMAAWESDDYEEVANHLKNGIEEVARAGADFFICPDNTAHLVLEQIIDDLPIPGMHMAEIVSHEIKQNGWKNVGLLGTKWTMTGTVYETALGAAGLSKFIPDEDFRYKINTAIFDELCQGIFNQETIDMFSASIDQVKNRGAECVILGCTEIPLIINEKNSSLPILDSTRLMARYAVRQALTDALLPKSGWIDIV